MPFSFFIIKRCDLKKLAIFFICLLLTGCQAITFSVDGLLNAPSIADEQSAIYQALIESAGKGIALEYPRNGEYRSAFILYDIDGDRQEEALAFYSLNSVSESNVKISVLDRDGDGTWRSMCELAGAGSSVDRVLFTGCDTVVGYSSSDYEENAVRMYRYNGGVLETVYENTYSILDVADLDNCGNNELTLVKRSGAGLSVNILKSDGGEGYQNHSLEIETGPCSIVGFTFGELGELRALYLDVLFESYGLGTEIVSLDGDGIAGLITQNGLLLNTVRPAGYSCRDYDGDGVVEIPTVSAFTGYETASWGDAEYMTSFWTFDPDSKTLVYESNAYCDLADGYILTIPNRWLNVVTLTRDSGTGEVTFRKYDNSAPSINSMTPIISFASSDSSGGGAYTSSGYTVLAETDSTTYYVRVMAGEDEQLVLTSDEIKDNFHTVG